MKQKTGDKATLKWVVATAKGTKRYVALLALLQMILGVAGMSQALIISGLVDSAVERNGSLFLRYCIFEVGLIVVLFVLRMLNSILDEYTRSTVENTFKRRLFRNLLYKDYASVTASHSGEWLTRLTSDATIVSGGIVHIIPGLAGTIVRLVYAVALLFWFVPELCGWILLGGAVTGGLTWCLRNLMKKLHLQVQTADTRYRVFMTERLSSMMILRTFQKEEVALKQGERQMKGHLRTRMRRNVVTSLFSNGFGLVVNTAYAAGAIYCGIGILNQVISYGTFTAVLQLVSAVQTPIANISAVFPQYSSLMASAERIMESERFYEEPQEQLVENISEFYNEKFQAIGLRNATFTYLPVENEEGQNTRRTVLRNVDMEIRKGEYVAFCGPSGCGKSTVLKLLMRLYRLDEGECYIRSADGDLPLTAAWRGMFSYVPQGNQLMSGTIREVVTFGDQTLMREDERIWQALKVACADQFMDEMPDGLDTLLGERGAGLSEGQMQRIAIARAIFSDRPVLLLDEATSALDEATEAKLLDNLRVMTDKTVIIVTHRPKALEITDKIIHFNPEAE